MSAASVGVMVITCSALSPNASDLVLFRLNDAGMSFRDVVEGVLYVRGWVGASMGIKDSGATPWRTPVVNIVVRGGEEERCGGAEFDLSIGESESVGIVYRPSKLDGEPAGGLPDVVGCFSGWSNRGKSLSGSPPSSSNGLVSTPISEVVSRTGVSGSGESPGDVRYSPRDDGGGAV
jgi:hypothetical protein